MILKKEIIARGDEKTSPLSLNVITANESNGMMRIYSAIGNFHTIQNSTPEPSKKSNANVPTNKK